MGELPLTKHMLGIPPNTTEVLPMSRLQDMLDAKRAAEAAAQDVTPESLVDAFAADWSKERVDAYLGEDTEPAPVTQEQVEERIIAGFKASLSARVEDGPIDWPEAGAEAAREVDDEDDEDYVTDGPAEVQCSSCDAAITDGGILGYCDVCFASDKVLKPLGHEFSDPSDSDFLEEDEEAHAKAKAKAKVEALRVAAQAAQDVMDSRWDRPVDELQDQSDAVKDALLSVALEREPVDEIDLLGKSPNIEVPTIGSSAVQVTVNFSQSAFRRLDRKESEKVTTANGAIKKAASVHKSLLPQCEQLTAIHLFVGRSRTAHYSMTLPWCDKGPRLLPTANLAAFHEHITGIQDKFNELCEAFYAVYPWEVAEAEAARGGAGTLTNDKNGQFDTSLYPPLEEVRKKFKMSIAYMPVPERGGFITDLQADASVMVNDHYDEFYRSATSSAMNEVWKKLYVPLQNMSERLDYPTRKENTKFRDTLVSNVMDIVSLLKVFNITNDPHLEACRVKLEEALYGVTPDGLRDNDTFRAQTKRSVDAVLKTLPSIDL